MRDKLVTMDFLKEVLNSIKPTKKEIDEVNSIVKEIKSKIKIKYD